MTKEAFIRNVTEQIRCVRARDGIARELSDHITDQAAAYEAKGEPHEEAVNRRCRRWGIRWKLVWNWIGSIVRK